MAVGFIGDAAVGKSADGSDSTVNYVLVVIFLVSGVTALVLFAVGVPLAHAFNLVAAGAFIAGSLHDALVVRPPDRMSDWIGLPLVLGIFAYSSWRMRQRRSATTGAHRQADPLTRPGPA